MATISTCIIVKNEVDNLPLLVGDLRRFSDEINIVDTGSTDGTLEWLKANEDNVLKVYEFEWVNHFAKARNFSLSKTTMEWTFWCDADDRISEALINKILELKPNLNEMDINVVSMPYDYTPTYKQYRNRLFRMTSKPYWECVCHECISCSDMHKIVLLDNEYTILHQKPDGNNSRNIEIFEKYMSEGNELNSRETLCYLREIQSIGRVDEAVNLALKVIFNSDAWEALVWNAMYETLTPVWMSSPGMAQVGIAIIDRYEKLKYLRGDIYYIRSCLYGILGDVENVIKDCFNAIRTVVNNLYAYNETPEFSKIFPAITIYSLINEELTRSTMLTILNHYKDHDIVKKFYECLENGESIDINYIVSKVQEENLQKMIENGEITIESIPIQ